MYGMFYRNLRLLWPGGVEMRRNLMQLERTQWFSPDELQKWQLARLRLLVKYAYDHVPYYHQLYGSLGIHPEDIRTPQDFESLPFLTRDDVNKNLELLVAPELRDTVRPNSTGGSTGQPMHFFNERAFSWWDPALEIRGRQWYGAHEGDKMAWVWGASRDMHDWDRKARFKAKVLQERYLNAHDMTDNKMLEFARTLSGWQPAVIRAYPSAASLFAERVRQHSISGIRPKVVETSAEKVTEPQRELIEEVFQCKVADWYTARELGTIAFQCPSGGHHVCETRYLEIVADGRVVQPGQLGEVVVTSLHQFAMPFIRYKLGDLATYETEPCTCGRGLPILREVEGRIQDFLVTDTGHYIYGGFFPHTLRHWPEIARYQVYQPDTKHLELKLVPREGVGDEWLDHVRKELHNQFGPGMQISIQIVDSIPLTSAGKHRYVISDVKPSFI